MTKEEWLVNFQAIYGRLPNYMELKEAQEDGEFVDTKVKEQSDQPGCATTNGYSVMIDQTGKRVVREPKKSSSRLQLMRRRLASFSWLLVGIVLFMSVVTIYMTGAVILNRYAVTGTWQQVKVKGNLKDPYYYGAGQKSSYLIIDKEHRLTAINSVQSQKVDDVNSQLALSDYLPSGLTVQPKKQRIVPNMTKDQYENRLEEIFHSEIPGYFSMNGQTKEVTHQCLTTYKNYLGSVPNYHLSYRVKGDTLIIKTRNAAGKVVLTCIFRRLPEEDAERIQKVYQSERTKFKDLYGQSL